ncbi:BON domain-containing protein [Rhodoferax saidenbachensis]|uniref:Osmotically-inducible protein Y n=1 Tax=Rhodoferax saidenbachensis TaxID=1484693 RepID=A0A1P8K709_9BURK|nr:BON domain-containing protein [Rhodoferax saidenbachensis]APW41790.1 transporter [Rhodoferax saidenbachensis]
MNTRIGTFILSTALVGVSALTLVGCEKTTPAMAAPAAETTVGTEIDDTVITSSVKSALLADADIRSFDFKVETRKGEVLLSGFVDNQAQVDRATAATRTVSGVKNVQNNVTLRNTPTTVGNKIDASIITSKVKAALLADTRVKSFDIAVVTRQDEVQLSGFVNNQDQIDRAIEVTRAVEGVRTVTNEMRIKQ